MYDFTFSVPTEIHFGKGCEEKAGALMRPWAKKVLMIYGSERIFSDGTGQRITASLEEAGCEVICKGGVKPNAESDWIEAAAELVRREGIEGILAVGGGSVMDSAKAVSAVSGYGGSLMELYENPELQPETCLPIGAIVTIPATASESNVMSVISDSASSRKIAKPIPATQPKFALLNPELTLTVSPYQTACGAFDIFSHAFERYFDLRRGSGLLDSMTESVMRTVIDVLPEVLSDPQSMNARGELMLAATVAHNDMLGPGGDFACHEISHAVTSLYGVPHGAALAMIIPAWCRYMWTKNPQRFEQFFRSVWRAEGEDAPAVIGDGILKMETYLESAGLSLKLEAEKDADDAVAALAEESLSGRAALGGGLAAADKHDIEAICRMFLVSVA